MEPHLLLVSIFLLFVGCCYPSTVQNFFSGPLHSWSSSWRLEKVGQCNMLMEKVSAPFSVLMIFIPGMWRIHGWSAWSGFLVVDKWRVSRFQHKNTWEALCVEDQRNSPWVAAEIAAKAPGIVQFNVFACNRKLTKHVKDGRLEMVMQLFQQMRQQGVSPNKFTFIQLIKALCCFTNIWRWQACS